MGKFGEPWKAEQTLNNEKTAWLYHGSGCTEMPIRKALRAEACVNACENMADPAAEIQRLREENAEMKRDMKAIALHLNGRSPGVASGVASKWLPKEAPNATL